MHEFKLTPEIKAKIASDDYEKIIESLMAFARRLLEQQHGDFLPFASTVDIEGKVAHTAAHAGAEYPTPQDLITLLSDALRAGMQQRSFRAFGVAVNVRALLPGYTDKVDAICCQLEAQGKPSLQVFVPYQQTANGWEYDQLVVLGDYRRDVGNV
jgi:hypothetical protein